MRCLVTGAAGMVGQAIKEVFSSYDLLLTDINELDVRKYSEMKKFIHSGIELIINLAALTDLEECDNYSVNAYETNCLGVANVRWLGEILNIPIVHLSTAGIFDGEKTVYYETDEPHPLNQYGFSKWKGEQALDGYDKAYIFRCSWMMGGGVNIDKKFINKIFKQLLDGKKEIKVYTHIMGSPTYTIDVAKSIKKALELEIPYGIYNCAGEGAASRFDVAEYFIKCLGVKGIKITKAKENELSEWFPCIRSNGEVLSNKKLIMAKASCMRDWRITVKEYTEKCYKPYLNFIH